MAVSSEQGLSSSSSAGNGSDNDTFTVPLRIVAPGTVAPHGSGAGEYAPTRLPSSTTDAPPIGGTQAQTREHVFGRCLLKRGALSYCPGQGKPQVTVDDAVLGFDSALYDRKMSPSSPQFDPTFDVDLLNAAIFRVGEVWASRDLLCKALDCRASCEGFTKKIEKKWVGCNRVGEPSSTRVFAGGELKANCTLHMTIKPLVKSRYERPKKQGETKAKYEYKDEWSKPIELVDNENAKVRFSTCHGGQCRPGRQNRIATQQPSGNYLKKIPDQTMYSLLHMYEQNGGCISSSTIKNVIGPVWPKHKAMTKHDVFNIKAKIQKLLPVFKRTNGDFQTFQEQATSSELLSGIDDAPSLNDDEAYDMAASAWFEIRNSFGGNSEEAVFQFVDYLELIQARAKGFTFKLAEDTSGKKSKLLGVLWMTATMRRNFELYGDYISLDMMKRGLNTLLWPYIGVAMYDNMRKLCWLLRNMSSTRQL